MDEAPCVRPPPFLSRDYHPTMVIWFLDYHSRAAHLGPDSNTPTSSSMHSLLHTLELAMSFFFLCTHVFVKKISFRNICWSTQTQPAKGWPGPSQFNIPFSIVYSQFQLNNTILTNQNIVQVSISDIRWKYFVKQNNAQCLWQISQFSELQYVQYLIIRNIGPSNYGP